MGRVGPVFDRPLLDFLEPAPDFGNVLLVFRTVVHHRLVALSIDEGNDTPSRISVGTLAHDGAGGNPLRPGAAYAAGILRKPIARRFHVLMVPMASVRSTISLALNW